MRISTLQPFGQEAQVTAWPCHWHLRGRAGEEGQSRGVVLTLWDLMLVSRQTVSEPSDMWDSQLVLRNCLVWETPTCLVPGSGVCRASSSKEKETEEFSLYKVMSSVFFFFF